MSNGDKPVSFKEFAESVAIHDGSTHDPERRIEVILPDGTTAYVASLISYNKSSHIKLVVEEKVTTTKWVQA